MTIEIELPDGSIAEFPDGMSDADIEQVLRQQFVQSAAQGAQGVAEVPRETFAPGAAGFNERFGIPQSDLGPEAFFQPQAGGLEAFGTLASGAVAEPIAGLAGIAAAPFGGADLASRAVEATRGALTLSPGPEAQQVLSTLPEAVPESIRAGFGALSEGFGAIADQAGSLSPALGAAVRTVPTAAAQAVGLAGARSLLKESRGFSRRGSGRALSQATPSQETLRATARSLYRELDNSGVVVRPRATSELVSNIQNELAREGVNPVLTPKAHAAMRQLDDISGQALNLAEMDTLRKVARIAEQSLDPADARLGSLITGQIDDFLDKASPRTMILPEGRVQNIGQTYRTARELWGRARRSELVGDAFERAQLQASGFENGIRAQFRSLLTNKRTRKLFNKEEIKALSRVVQGSRGENLFRLIGKMGVAEGSAVRIVGPAIGAAAGAAIFGPAGAAGVPMIGQVSMGLAQRLTRGNAAFADAVIRAGRDGRRITAAYLKNTPRAQRSADELGQLLMQPYVDLSELTGAVDAITGRAARFAARNRAAMAGVTAGVAATQSQTQQPRAGIR